MIEWTETCNRLAEVWWPQVIHASWQAALVAALMLVLVRSGRRWPPTLRYALLFVALLKFVLPPVLPVSLGVFGLVDAPGTRNAAQQSPGIALVQSSPFDVAVSSERVVRTEPTPGLETAPIAPAAHFVSPAQTRISAVPGPG